MFEPVVGFLTRKCRFSRGWASLVALLLTIGIFGSLVVFLLSKGVQVLPRFFQHLAHFFTPLYQWGYQLGTEEFNQLLTTWGTKLASGILKSVHALAHFLQNGASMLLVSFLAAFFISKDWVLLQQYIPVKYLLLWGKMKKEFGSTLLGFLKAQLILHLLTVGTIFIGFLLLGVPYALLFSVFIGLVDFFPFFGTGFVFLPWSGYAWFTGNKSLAMFLLLLYLFVFVQRQVVEPKLVASQIGIHPLATLFAAFTGFQIFGVIGLFMGPMLAFFCLALWRVNK